MTLPPRACTSFQWLGFWLGLLTGLVSPTHAQEWTDLLDRELSQWRTYLSFRHQPGYNGRPPVDAAGVPLEPIGYDHDPAGVFTVLEQDGEPVLRISGEIYGCVFTRAEFTNYRLRLQVRWGELKWPPREALLKDSGILYHSIGPAGVDYWRSWMLSQEFQIMEGHMGDYWAQANSAIDIRALLPEGMMNSVASVRQPFRPFGAGESVAPFCLRSIDAETPDRGWTELELVCFNGRSVHLVNGQVVMVLRDSRYVTDGIAHPLTRGRIQLQSEAAEVFFRRIQLQMIDDMPEELVRLFDDSIPSS